MLGPRHVSAIAIAFVIAACSGSSANAPAADGGVDASSSGYTLDDVCAKVPPKVCALRQSCCAKSLGFDETQCEAFEALKCTSNVTATRAGTMTFDGSGIDACLARLAPYFTTCYLTFDDYERYAADDFGCAAFAGKLAEGAPCARNEECAPSTTPSAIATCDRNTSKCKTTTFLDQNASCDFGPGINQYCKTGLYCEFTATDAGTTGACHPATPNGSACSSADPYGLECGIGSHCDGASGTCKPALPGGSACVSAFDCASLGCTGQICDPQTPAVHTDECGVISTDGGSAAD